MRDHEEGNFNLEKILKTIREVRKTMKELEKCGIKPRGYRLGSPWDRRDTYNPKIEIKLNPYN